MRIYDDPLHMMELCGGSFVKSLEHCYCMADAKGRVKLREAFKEYFDEYERKFELWKQQHQEVA